RAPINSAPTVIDNPGLDRAKQLEDIETAQVNALKSLDERLLPLARTILNSYDSAKLDYHAVRILLLAQPKTEQGHIKHSTKSRSLWESLMHTGKQVKFDRDRLVNLCGEEAISKIDSLTPAEYAVGFNEIAELKPLLPLRKIVLVDMSSERNMVSATRKLQKSLPDIDRPWEHLTPYASYPEQGLPYRW